MDDRPPPHSPPASVRSRHHHYLSAPTASATDFNFEIPMRHRHRAASLDYHGIRINTPDNLNSNGEMARNNNNSSSWEMRSNLQLQFSPRRNTNNNNRVRAASHDVILNIDDVLPRYNCELAERIGSITDEDVRSFAMATPDRNQNIGTRGRANTCPRPQRSEGNASSISSGAIIGPLSPLRLSMDDSIPLEIEPEVDRDGDSGDGTVQQSENNNNLEALEASNREDLLLIPTVTSPTRRSHSAMTPLPNSSISSSQNNNTNPPNINNNNAVSIPPRLRTTPCIFRINQYLIKSFMLLTLYATLSYTWHHDLRHRYKSVEINAGLSEYWNGERKLINDDANVDDIKSKLLLSESAISINSSGGSNTKKKRQPMLSRARSLDSVLASTSSSRRGLVSRRNEESNAWSVTRMVWWLVCAGFMLPIVEVGYGEIRRYFRWRRWRMTRSNGVRDL